MCAETRRGVLGMARIKARDHVPTQTLAWDMFNTYQVRSLHLVLTQTCLWLRMSRPVSQASQLISRVIKDACHDLSRSAVCVSVRKRPMLTQDPLR